MNPIKFLEPADFSEAVSLLDQYADDAKIVAGGTSVVLMLQQKLIAPSVLISLASVPDCDYIRMREDGLHLGALAKIRDIERSEIVQMFSPALAHTFHVVANVRVRNQATIGGNLAAADYAADPPAMLTALDARVQVQGPQRTREIPINEFFIGFYTTALQPNEILTEVIIPSLPISTRASYHKYTSISAEGRPCVAVGAVADFDADARCSHLRVAVGAATETPQRVSDAEEMAHGYALTDDLIAAIADEYARTIDPLTDVRGSAWYRKEMIRVFVKRALQEVRDGNR
jgi:carbon-monoxide dehydrogenase medium subunit